MEDSYCCNSYCVCTSLEINVLISTISASLSLGKILRSFPKGIANKFQKSEFQVNYQNIS